MNRGHGMVTHTQAELDAAFADLEHLLGESRPQVERVGGSLACTLCGGSVFEFSPRTCDNVCVSCGAVHAGLSLPIHCHYTNSARRPTNYKRIHHWHERISQLLLCESPIPDEHFEIIREKLTDGTYSVINKDCIRAVLRSLDMQLYIASVKYLMI